MAFAIGFGVLSTLPLGPSGLSIVSSFALKGTKKGIISLSALALAEIIYLCIALTLRSRGVLQLSNSFELVCTLVFGFFLVAFGSITLKQSKERSKSIPQSFKTIFIMSLMNPSLIISYLGLIILMDKSSGGYASGVSVLSLSTVFLLTVWMTLISLGKIAQMKKDFINNNMHSIKSIVGPLFIFVGVSTLVSTI
jgi:threonine/homoserine/homoserine lactone efflux protein